MMKIEISSGFILSGNVSADVADTDSKEYDVDYEYARLALEKSIEYYPKNI